MKKKILVIEDTPELRKLTKLFLMSQFEVETAENGLNALAFLRTGYRPDLIVTDLVMPEVDGKELIKQLKSSGLYKDIPVIVLSSINQSAERISLLSSGADDYLIKPYNPSELEIRIVNQLKKTA